MFSQLIVKAYIKPYDVKQKLASINAFLKFRKHWLFIFYVFFNIVITFTVAVFLMMSAWGHPSGPFLIPASKKEAELISFF